MKGQASLEWLVVLAATIAFAAVMLPQEQAISQRAHQVLAERVFEMALDRTAQLAEQAWAAGEGTQLEAEVRLPGQESEWHYTSEDSKLHLLIQVDNQTKTYNRTVPPMKPFTQTLEPGAYRVWAVYEDLKIKLNWEKN